MLQCFVRTADLDKVYAAAGKVLAAANVNAHEAGGLQILLRPGRRGGRRGHLREADAGDSSSCKRTSLPP